MVITGKMFSMQKRILSKQLLQKMTDLCTTAIAKTVGSG